MLAYFEIFVLSRMLHFNADQDCRSATYQEKLIKEDFNILLLIVEEDNCIFFSMISLFECLPVCKFATLAQVK